MALANTESKSISTFINSSAFLLLFEMYKALSELPGELSSFHKLHQVNIYVIFLPMIETAIEQAYATINRRGRLLCSNNNCLTKR